MAANEELVCLLGEFTPVTAKRAITKMSQPEWMAANGFTSQEDKQMIELLIKYLHTVASKEI